MANSIHQGLSPQESAQMREESRSCGNAPNLYCRVSATRASDSMTGGGRFQVPSKALALSSVGLIDSTPGLGGNGRDEP